MNRIIVSISFLLISCIVWCQESTYFTGEICYEYYVKYTSTSENPIPPSLLTLSEPKIKCYQFTNSDTITSCIIVQDDTVNISILGKGFHETYFSKKGVGMDFSALRKKKPIKSSSTVIQDNIFYKEFPAKRVEIKRATGDVSHRIVSTSHTHNFDTKKAEYAGVLIFEDGLTLFDSTYSPITPELYMEKFTVLHSIRENGKSARMPTTSDIPSEVYVPKEKIAKNINPLPIDLRDVFQFAGIDEHREMVDPEVFKGSYNYVALWASWCAPCIRSIAFLSDLNSAPEFEDIQVVSLSIDDAKDFDKWLKKSNEEFITWDNFFLNGGLDSITCRQLGVSAIPYYFIVDRQGRIMLENAPSPSDPKLKEVLRAFLSTE